MRYTYNDLLADIHKIPEHRRGSLIDASLGDDGDTYYVISLEEMHEEQDVEHQADVDKLTIKEGAEFDRTTGEWPEDNDTTFLLGPAEVKVDEDTLVLGPAEEEPKADELTLADDEALVLPPDCLVDDVDLLLALQLGDEQPIENATFSEFKIKDKK